MRPLPHVDSLESAVREVIRSNRADGYPPTRFIQITAGKSDADLRSACERLILRGETLEALERAFKKYTTLLTLEDLVSRLGADWGFSPIAMETAAARATYFDQQVGQQRYE
jgi:hypothetical protein